jgi:hypothetical protein
MFDMFSHFLLFTKDIYILFFNTIFHDFYYNDYVNELKYNIIDLSGFLKRGLNYGFIQKVLSV